MKRILIFSLAYHPFVGGAEVAIQEITKRISSEDVAFDVITLRLVKDSPSFEKMGNVGVYRVGSFGRGYAAKVFFPLLAAIMAYRLHRRTAYDALWAMMTYMLFPLVIARMLGVRIPYALTLQDGDPFEHVFGRWHILPLSPLLIYGFRHAAAVQAISTFLAHWARQSGFEGPLEIIPNGVDTARFATQISTELRQEVRHAMGVEEGDVLLITTSRLVQKNALDEVIRSLSFLAPHIKFAILGSGPLRTDLENLAGELGLSNRVIFLGHVEHSKLPDYLHSADIFVRPSRSEGMGNSFIEAFAAGLPVIATQVGGIADFLYDRDNNPEKPTTGFAVSVDAPDEIAQKVQTILRNPDMTESIVDTARALALKKYDWNSVAHDLREKIFNSILS